MNSVLLTNLSPNIRHYVETLIRDGKVGICAGAIMIKDIFSSSSTYCNSRTLLPTGDRFKVVLPYAGRSVVWEVLFDCVHPEEPPDFIFDLDDRDFCPCLENIGSLVHWDAQNSKALLFVLHELIDQYRVFQQQIITDNYRLQYEYETLLDQTDIKPEEIEIHVTRTESNIGPVQFLIKLSVDFSRIPPYLTTKEDPGEDSAVLLINYLSPDATKCTPKLYLSPRVENALGGSSNLRIPSFAAGESIKDYVARVSQLLKSKVDHVVLGYEKRKEYIAAFLSHFGRSVLEYDEEGFSKISFLFEWNDFFFLLLAELPLYFPKDQPILIFQSIYHESKGKPYTEVKMDYPYSPRWSGNEMAERARAYILENISSFQKASVFSGTL